MNELIIVKQLPIIEERLKELSNEIDEKVNNATSLVCTSDTVKEVKKVRAELNNEFKELESQRKIVKEQIMKPYNDFEDIYKSYVTEKFKTADNTLKDKIDSVENQLKNEKEEELRTFANECFVKNEILEYVNYEDIKLNVTLSASMKSLKEQITSFCERIVKDLELIVTQEYKDEILYEYKKYLDATIAIVEVKKRHEEMEKAKQVAEEKKEQKLTDEEMINKIDSLVAPKVEEQIKLFGATFEVKTTLEKLQNLVKYMRENEIEFNQINGGDK